MLTSLSIARRSCRYFPAIRFVLACGLAGSLLSTACADPSMAELAEAELGQAEVAIASARAQDALWTTGFDALVKARAARRQGDYASVIEWSRRARELARLGIEQRERAPAIR